MSDIFQFSQRSLSLTLEGQVFEISIDQETLEICTGIRTDVKGYLAELNGKSVNTDSTSETVCTFFEGCIDKLLGDGATKRIFGERPLKLLDLAELLCFILSRVSKAFARRFAIVGEDL